MNNRIRNLMKVCRTVAACFLVYSIPTLAVGAELQDPPAYIGSQTCIACHEAEGRAWSGSHHALAWTLPTSDANVGDFDGTEFSGHGVTARFKRSEDHRQTISVTETDGITSKYNVHSVVGIEPLQQYLVETEPGRLQSFDIVWDVEKKRWYHLYPDQDLPPDDGLHWSGPYKNWNGRCAECHATGFDKNYDQETRSFESTQAEIGVGCEACHGPGSAHLTWAKSLKTSQTTPDLPGYGFPMEFGQSVADDIEQCAGCHARREAFGDGNPLPGTAFSDAYKLALLRPGLYHPDGQILDEVYVYGSFLQSKMYAKGVGCMNCHNAHTAELVAEGNAVCTQCHSPAGNPNFASLQRKEYDSETHHFHTSGSEGAQCKSCHMIERTYMGIDGRRDHSFRVPRPDLATQTGSPDACTNCHAEQDSDWATAQIAEWYPNSQNRGAHFGTTLAKGYQNAALAAADLSLLAADETQPGIARATAIWLLEAGSDPDAARALAPLLYDPDPLLRAAAARLQRTAPEVDRASRLAPVLADPDRSVRIAAAEALLDVSGSAFSGADAAAYRLGLSDWQNAIANRLDFPETHLQLGGFALVRRNLPAANSAFREVVALDPQRADAWSMLVRIAAATEGPGKARVVLNEALTFNPDNQELLGYDQELPK